MKFAQKIKPCKGLRAFGVSKIRVGGTLLGAGSFVWAIALSVAEPHSIGSIMMRYA